MGRVRGEVLTTREWYRGIIVGIYLDYNATAPVPAEVADAVSAALRDCPGNASSIHAFGQRAKALLDEARSSVARLIGAEPSEIVFTSGGTEADNLAVRGVGGGAARAGRARRLSRPPSSTRRSSTRPRRSARRGWPVTLLPVAPTGIVAVDALASALDAAGERRPALVSVMLANNELGTLQPVREMAALARARGVLFHTDAVQAVGRIAVDVGGARRGPALARRPQVRGAQRRGRAVGQARPRAAGAVARRPPGARDGAPAPRTSRRSRACGWPRSWPRGSSASEPARQAALRDRLERGLLASSARRHRQRRPGTRACQTRRTSASRASKASRW